MGNRCGARVAGLSLLDIDDVDLDDGALDGIVDGIVEGVFIPGIVIGPILSNARCNTDPRLSRPFPFAYAFAERKNIILVVFTSIRFAAIFSNFPPGYLTALSHIISNRCLPLRLYANCGEVMCM